MMASGTLLPRLQAQVNVGRSLIGIISRKISIKSEVLSNGLSKQKHYFGKVKLRQQNACLLTVHSSKPTTFVNILTSTDTELLITAIFKLNKFARVGSGAVESTIKQIDRRLKLSGAQWKQENLSQVLAHRCTYLNGLLS